MNYAIAVLDVGMTNKKVVVYDDGFNQLECISRQFPVRPVQGCEGIEEHDLPGIVSWFLETLADLAPRFPIRVISVTAHGASFVCVDDLGKPCVPCIAYTYEPGEEFHSAFYACAGDPGELQRSTGTPNLKALINLAKGIYFAKKRFPEAFGSVRRILMYPQYYGFALTGKAGIDPTYTGCHTYLWNFAADTWSGVADILDIRKLLPGTIEPSWARLGTITGEIAERTGLQKSVIVTLGIHDSNASLLPYLATQGGRDFVLDSTGTWCVTMHPQKRFEFSRDDIGKVVFFNRAATLDPVKTAIFLGGLEYDEWRTRILGDAGTDGGASDPAFDPEVYRRVIREKRAFILPEVVPGSGQFPGSLSRAVSFNKTGTGETEYSLNSLKAGAAVPEFFSDRPYAMAALNISLALQTEVAVKRVGLVPGSDLFIEGGFRKNPDYAALLASLLSESSVCLTDITEATSFGAAMTARMAMEGLDLEDLASGVVLRKTPVRSFTIDDPEGYRRIWRMLAG